MRKLILLLLIVVTFSCKDNTEQYEKISGKWNCSSWISVNSDVDKCRNNVSFIFNADKTYSSKLGSAEESGTFKISGDKLHTLPEGKMEIVTKILILNADSLKLLMNQAGVEENLLLIKEK